MKKKLFIVHCIDTEGPLNESIGATFERLYEIYGIKIAATKENLLKIQNKKMNLGGLEDEISKTFSYHLLNYNNSWEKIDLMLDKIMSKQYRSQYPDSFGNGIIYNWHCMDNVGFSTNLRQRDIGFGNIFNHYKFKIKEYGNLDSIHWHFHPLTFSREAHLSSTSYDNSYDILHEILCRRLIDNNWFPIVNRAGFHAIRQDSSFFLEQWIPFDYSNQALYFDEKNNQSDNHRFGDWRRAPKEWLPYHPSYDDYQSPGEMNRYTTKCLNIGTRENLLTNYEIEMAFKNAQKYGAAILAFTNHDFRDMSTDIDDVYKRIKTISKNFNNVSMINSCALSAMQKILFSEDELNKDPIKIDINILSYHNYDKLIVNLKSGKVFGSQPYLALKTKQGEYFHDNFNENSYQESWEYIFDNNTLNIKSLDKIAVASNDKFGFQSINILKL